MVHTFCKCKQDIIVSMNMYNKGSRNYVEFKIKQTILTHMYHSELRLTIPETVAVVKHNQVLE